MTKFDTYLSLLKFSISHPKQGISLFKEFKNTNSNNKENLKKFSVQPKTVSEILLYLFKNSYQKNNSLKSLESHLENFFKQLDLLDYPSKKKPYPVDYSILGDSGPFLYYLCKEIKPEIIIETGVAYGVSSSYILQALNENKKGQLISIDSIFRPWQTEEMIGSAIPTSLKSRWDLCVGSSDNLLDNIFQKYSQVDIFLHDSLHTYQNMMFEFKKSWPYIKSNGYLLSDDILENNAFYDFCNTLKKKPSLLYQRLQPVSLMGIIQK